MCLAVLAVCEIVVKRLYSRKFQIGGMIHTKDPKIVFILTWIDEDRIEFRLLFSQPRLSTSWHYGRDF